MAQLTADEEKIAQLQSLFPEADVVYGTPYLPRNFVLPMSELLQWPENTAHDSDYKKPGQSFKDKISKSGILLSKQIESQWTSESQDNYRGFLYDPENGRLYPSTSPTTLDVVATDTASTAKPRREILEDEAKDMYATEYKKAFTTLTPEPPAPVPDKRVTKKTTRSRSRTRGKSKERKVEETKDEETPKEIQNKATIKSEQSVKTKKSSVNRKELNADISEKEDNIGKSIRKGAKARKAQTQKKSSTEKTTIPSLQEHAKTITKVKETETAVRREPDSKKKVTWAKQTSEEKAKPSKTIVSIAKPDPKPLSKSMPK
eukprot:TRINITY_DN11999_c0_g1_i1.p1 TRINITY_DN11999_c0_g1~~TRINITY_DN11999_c0_g1_i1.p1  ORF type:complete len:317 (-),score=76.07 TRINITY_DN11999_c0_g1_i1:115-1065(-)